jgi:hypothetical protein
MANHPSRGLRAAGGLWGPPAPALRGTVKRWFPTEPANDLDAWCRSEHSSAAKSFSAGVDQLSCRRHQVVARVNLTNHPRPLTGQLG